MAKMGRHSDKEPRKFLMVSNIVQQTSYTISALTPLVPGYFLPIAGVSNIAANISFTGFGAINAKCIGKLASGDNIGEIYAKISVISTLGSSIGLGLGLALTSAVPDHSVRACIIPILGIARALTYNQAVKDLI